MSYIEVLSTACPTPSTEAYLTHIDVIEKSDLEPLTEVSECDETSSRTSSRTSLTAMKIALCKYPWINLSFAPMNLSMCVILARSPKLGQFCTSHLMHVRHCAVCTTFIKKLSTATDVTHVWLIYLGITLIQHLHLVASDRSRVANTALTHQRN